MASALPVSVLVAMVSLRGSPPGATNSITLLGHVSTVLQWTARVGGAVVANKYLLVFVNIS